MSQIETGDAFHSVKAFTYDAAGNRIGFSLTNEGKQEISLAYAYDALNRISSVSKGDITIARYIYDDSGNRASLTYPESGLTVSYVYNDANLITCVENKKGDAILSGWTYSYFLNGDMRSKRGKDNRATSYDYDGRGYRYDAFGNEENPEPLDSNLSVTAASILIPS